MGDSPTTYTQEGQFDSRERIRVIRALKERALLFESTKQFEVRTWEVKATKTGGYYEDRAREKL